MFAFSVRLRFFSLALCHGSVGRRLHFVAVVASRRCSSVQRFSGFAFCSEHVNVSTVFVRVACVFSGWHSGKLTFSVLVRRLASWSVSF